MVEDFTIRNGRQPQIWFPFYGCVEANTVGWEAVRSGMPIRMLRGTVSLPPSTKDILEWVDFLVLPQYGQPGVIKTPTMCDQEEFHKRIKEEANWEYPAEVRIENSELIFTGKLVSRENGDVWAGFCFSEFLVGNRVKGFC
ncbi:MAG: hypothetical protein N2035_09415 [Chthoniobacterales bacterium]|nr:hypothetical protein [Chthoniobacterales bacterium]MCX7713860.1 hypothetical protein [Chthoniobacterales bacterium]